MQPQAVADVRALFISWQGTYVGMGEGQFPTMPPFRYREVLNLIADAERPILRFEQRTWLVDESGADIRASHWEVGFLTGQDDGSLLLTSAQTGRLESFRGQVEWLPQGIVIHWTGVQHVLDSRVLQSAREWMLTDASLHYRQWMATTQVAAPTLHLSAQLTRSPQA